MLRGARVEADGDITLQHQCEKVVIGKAPNMLPGSTILVEGTMDDLVSGIGVANTLTRIDQQSR